MPLGCSMELYNMWSCYSYHILLEKLLEDVLISSDKNYCSALIFHLFHNNTSNHTLVMYINISSFEISLWCQKVISIQTGLVRQTSTKILVLLNNQFKKKSQRLYYCTQQQQWHACEQKGVHMKNSADTERHRSILLSTRKSKRYNGLVTPRVLNK